MSVLFLLFLSVFKFMAKQPCCLLCVLSPFNRQGSSGGRGLCSQMPSLLSSLCKHWWISVRLSLACGTCEHPCTIVCLLHKRTMYIVSRLVLICSLLLSQWHQWSLVLDFYGGCFENTCSSCNDGHFLAWFHAFRLCRSSRRERECAVDWTGNGVTRMVHHQAPAKSVVC